MSLKFLLSLIFKAEVVCGAAAKFWDQHPALLYGIAAWTGASAALFLSFTSLVLLFLVPLLLLSAYRTPGRCTLAAALATACYFWAMHQHQKPNLQGERLEGIAKVNLSAVVPSKTAFGNQWSYRGTLQAFWPADETHSVAKNIPVTLSLPAQTKRPAAGYIYLLKAALKQDERGNYRLSPIKKQDWIALERSDFFAEWRARLKADFHTHLQSAYQDSAVAAFLAGISTGEFNDRLLSFELNRFGLLHLMAISGLHFALLAGALLFISNLLFAFFGSAATKNRAPLCVLAALSAYFFVLGGSPSIFRAWIAIALAVCALLLKREARSLNSLGVALLAAVFWNPFWIVQIGFQFSFMVTASILFFATPCERLLEKLFCRRTLSQMVELGWQDQLGYCVLTVLKKGVALAMAVNLTALPLTLYYFHAFPVLSLLYNLFFPFLVAVSLILLLLALACGLLPWLGDLLHAANSAYTGSILKFVVYLPKQFDYKLYSSALSLELLSCYLILLFGVGLLLYRTRS